MPRVHRATAPDAPEEAEDALAPRLLFRTTVALVWRALERTRLTPADRDDIAQNVALRAFRRRSTYRAKRGNLEQWLSGILRNEIRRYLKAQGRQPVLLPAPGDVPLDTPSEAPTPEESVSLSELADQAFAFLPPTERRAVILHELEGRTLREVAAIEGISPATAFSRHKRGMAALRAVAEEQQQSGVVPVPVALAALLGADAAGPGPSPELLERAWRRALVELDHDGPPESGPRSRQGAAAPSPARDGERPPSRPPPSLHALLGPLAGALLAGLVAAPALRHCGHASRDEPAATAPVAIAAAPTSPASPASASAALETSPIATASPAPAPPPAPPPTAARRAAVATEGERDDEGSGDERALMDQARAALTLENLPAAVEALAAHARRFPGGQNAVMREQMWAEACARHRRAHPQGDVPAMDLRCARR